MRYLAASLLSLALAGAGSAQQWEVGGGGGVAFFKNATVTAGGQEADAGLKPGPVFSAFATHNMYQRIGGEIRYTLGLSELKVSSGGQETTFRAQTHAVHYDVLIFAGDAEAGVRPYLIGGGGMKVYRGTDKETAAAPALANFAILSHTQQIEPLIVFGAGARIRVAPRTALRLEVRDYLTPTPKDVIAPVPPAKLSGWIHGFTPLVGLSFGF